MSTKYEQLKKEGWKRQFTYDEPRLSEAKELYESLGYEVHLEPATKEEIIGDCSVCLEEYMDRYKTLYTRKRKEK